MAFRSLLVVLLATAAVAEKATPIEKVTQLLKGLQTKVEAEGKKEAAAYDKYACFCKEQADEKLYAIEKSTEKIGELTAQIKSLDADIAELSGEIGKLSKKVSGLDTKIDIARKARDVDHGKYLVRAGDLSEAIEACTAAIETIKDSKKGLKDAKLNLAQVHSTLLRTASRQAMSSKAMTLIDQLKQAPAKYTFQGNDIIATLEDLLDNFNEMKKKMDETEFDVNSLHEKEALGDANERKFAQKEKDEKEAISEAKSEERMQASENNDEEKNDRGADQSFLDTLTAQCEEKAKLFDQRSSTRADELTAMTGAIEELEKGVKENAGANSKLVGLVQGPVSFMQIRGTLQQDANRAVRRVQELLQAAASDQNSEVLKGAAVRVQLSADHFVKVRTLIKDLIGKLEDDAASEATQKGFCDKHMNKAITNRDEGKANQEAAQNKIATLQATEEQLGQDIKDLAEQITESHKALNEATELRDDERSKNEETVLSAEAGKLAVNNAQKLLSNFYENAFLQTKKYTPPQSDRDGNTVGDLAPKFGETTEEYHGAQGESKGIMGILDVIASDFERTISTVTEDEKTAQGEFEKFEKESHGDIDTNQGTSDKKEGELKKTRGDKLEEEQNLKDATDLFDSGVEKLDDLKAACVEGEESWEERAAARKKEIEALKDAQNILAEWQS